jgi:2'-5' RNA ligase
MRVFFAIEFDDDVKRHLRDVQDIVKRTTYSGNFTHYGNFHLTIKYIGTITNGDYDELIEIMEDVADHIAPFTLRIGDIGVFHKNGSDIVWVGITQGKPQVKHLFEYLEREVVASGFEPEGRKYRPHVTLGKKIVFQDTPWTNGLPYYDRDIPVESLTLFLSHRIDGNLTYTPLHHVTLKGER